MTNLNQATLKKELPLTGQIEALLFVAPGAVGVSQLAAALGVTNRIIEKTINQLEQDYKNRGLRLQRHGGRIQMTSAPEAAEAIEIFLGLEATSRLSSAALEALAIIAYQQPVTRPQVDAVRGVNSDGVMKNLLHKGLIQEIGRAEGPGRRQEARRRLASGDPSRRLERGDGRERVAARRLEQAAGHVAVRAFDLSEQEAARAVALFAARPFRHRLDAPLEKSLDPRTPQQRRQQATRLEHAGRRARQH